MRSAVGGSGVALLVAGSLVYAAVSPGAAPPPAPGDRASSRPSPLRELRLAQPALGRSGTERVTQRRVLVRPARGTSINRLRTALERHGGVLAGRVGATPFFAVRADSSAMALRALRGEAAIARAEADYRRGAAAAPDDVLYRAGWNQRAQLGAARIPQAWATANPANGVRVAVLDTGVDLDHPDLAPVLVGGFDAVEGDGVPDDDEGHGTFVAGVAAAATDNDRGVARVGWGARVMPVKVLGADGAGADSNIAEGIMWAADHGADVILLALSGPDDGAVLRSAIEYAQAREVAVIAAAGNGGLEQAQYPAAYPNVRVIERDAGRRLRVTVTATSAGGTAAAHSRVTAVVRALAGPTTIRGSSQDDTLIGTAGPDIILGRTGDDRLTGGGGADRLYGGPGGDELAGGPGSDLLDGGPGTDRAMTAGLDRRRSVEAIGRR